MKIKEIIFPKTIDEAYNIISKYPKSIVIAGGAWLKFVSPEADYGIDLSDLGLNRIIETKDEIEIEAMTTLNQVENHPAIIQLGGGILSKSIGSILGVPFRNIATFGGSIFGKYGFSDILTPLLCFDVKLNFYHHKTMNLEDYLNQKERFNDILISVIIKKTSGLGYFKKVSNTILDFSIINIAVSYFKGNISIVVGARPGIAKKAYHAMNLAHSKQSLKEEDITLIAETAINELTFGSNHLASLEYRKEVAKVYIERGLKEVCL